MNRIFFLLIAIHVAALSKAQTRPNVIFILADDLGYGDLGCYGQTKIETPNLDKLAMGGIRFTQFYAGTSVCAPSRASLMTGLHTGHTPIRGNYEIKPEGQLPLPDSAVIIPELFKSAGYKTGVFGKWGLGYPGSEGDPMKQGVDQFFGYNCQRQSHNFFPGHLWSNDERIPLANTVAIQTQYAPELIQNQALNFIESNKNQPFLAFLTYTLPHAALQLPAGDETFEYYKRKFKEQPVFVTPGWTGSGYQPQAYPHAAYAAMVSKLDQYVGEVLAKLKALNLDQNTFIVFTSDNGPHAEGGNDPAFFNSNGGFTGIKRQLNEGGIRAPMIVNWPGSVKPGQTADHIGAFWDFLPTFAELINVKMKVKTDGISLIPLLLQNQKQKNHTFLYWEFHEDGGRQALRMGKWKAIREQVFHNPNSNLRLYSLNEDPQEKHDVASLNPKIVKKMNEIIMREHIEHKVFPFLKN